MTDGGLDAPKNPDRVFPGFCRKWFERRGRPLGPVSLIFKTKHHGCCERDSREPLLESRRVP
ncbi:hypothetical protein BG454_04785 [Roseinatronobacter bogoriensis subsp. barguzinensis]|uniref:Uncharacterized protein n=1 Tax=Roseinatronobacter bogoriensis subsp. barguzinensis TaxID=441209 RepID=A0A2K8K6Z6_9RHOB|nr:hypothetical protein BG454_04785 [Rhodobaca barguzinensis]